MRYSGVLFVTSLCNFNIALSARLWFRGSPWSAAVVRRPVLAARCASGSRGRVTCGGQGDGPACFVRPARWVPGAAG